MSARLDVIIIGSGFGGAVAACRLAEKGLKVLVLERGRRWSPQDFPRKPDDPWVFNSFHPSRQNGWLDLRFFDRMTVAQGAAVGGGSLAYSNAALEAHPSLFDSNWPPEITYTELKPYYERVSAMMNLQTVPDGQLTQRFKLAADAAKALGHTDRMSKVPLAVSFSPEWSYGLPDPFDSKHSRPFVNAQGQPQGTCIHLGNCEVGCDVRAKNTLDLNYLARAEQLGAEVRPLHVVRSIQPADDAYRVVFDRIRGTELIHGYETATRVVLSAGSLGSTELLLRCRDEHGTLPGISRLLGHNWSANANVLSLAAYDDAARVQQTVGPPITGVIDFMDGQADGPRFVVEDDGFPDVLMNALRACATDQEMRTDIGQLLLEHITEHTRSKERARNLMMWLGAGTDASDGQLTLKPSLRDPTGRALQLSWKPERSAPVVSAIQAMHRAMTEATGGRLLPNPAWSVFQSLFTLHPLGGCQIGVSPETGVVDHLGHVFGYPNLFVVDGSVLPSSMGRNPSHTIAALSERVAAHIH